MQIANAVSCYTCGEGEIELVFTYDAPPVGETKFSFASQERYHREVLRCSTCGHFMSLHNMDDSQLYSSEYVGSTYGDDGMRRSFERIISLDPSQSDNVGRCAYIHAFAQTNLRREVFEQRQPTILDIGSGLCVFLHRMRGLGWSGTAVDPDPRAAAHARDRVGVQAWCGDFFAAPELGRFDVVSFNKVLEHVTDPVQMLAQSHRYLSDGGFVYVELPDGECAVAHGPGREEFFIEHHHVFSAASLVLVASRAGFVVRALERLQEPSTKFTLRAFLTPVAGIHPELETA